MTKQQTKGSEITLKMPGIPVNNPEGSIVIFSYGQVVDVQVRRMSKRQALTLLLKIIKKIF